MEKPQANLKVESQPPSASPNETILESESDENMIGIAGRFLSSAYQVVCKATWIFFSILMFSYGPILFETELQRNAQLEESKEKPKSPKWPMIMRQRSKIHKQTSQNLFTHSSLSEGRKIIISDVTTKAVNLI